MFITQIIFFLSLSAVYPSILYPLATLSWCFIALWYNRHVN